MEVTRLKNEYFRNKLFQDDLKNRKKMVHVLHNLFDENKRWVTDGG
jgi:hypothetical protein